MHCARRSCLPVILKQYKKSARYLQRVDDIHVGVKFIEARGLFTIRSPCYIKSTGHVNLVDMQICFNQLGLVAVYEAFSYHLCSPSHNSTFFSRVLLKDMHMNMLKSVDCLSFCADIHMQRVAASRSIYSGSRARFNTEIRFYSDETRRYESVFARGKATVVVL